MKKLLLAAFATLLLVRGADAASKEAREAPGPRPLAIEKILPFAGADNVRIEATLKLAPGVSATVEGEILPWKRNEESDLAATEGPRLWAGHIGAAENGGRVTSEFKLARHVTKLRPRLWNLDDPNLYVLKLTAAVKTRGASAGAPGVESTVRFGFRSFDCRDGRFHLNGKAVFLRGNAVNPPRGSVGIETREFAAKFVTDMKEKWNHNLIRTSGDVWLNTCDELGILVFKGCYGRRGVNTWKKSRDTAATVEYYKRGYFEQHVKHPSVVINVLSNEVQLRGDQELIRFFRDASAALKEWDPNRLIMANAGFGKDAAGDILDSHPYYGYYQGSFLTFLRLREDYRESGAPRMPWTFTECVGSYTQGNRFSTLGKHMSAGLTWVGRDGRNPKYSLRYPAFLSKNGAEMARRMRARNPQLAGYMPFTDPWFGFGKTDRSVEIKAYEDMKPKPQMLDMALAYQPVLVSIECWMPNAYAGAQVAGTIHIVNDSEDFADIGGGYLTLSLRDASGSRLASNEIRTPPVPYYGTTRIPVQLLVPADTPTGDYRLTAELAVRGRKISENYFPVFIASPRWVQDEPTEALSRQVFCGVPIETATMPFSRTAGALTAAGITFTATDSTPGESSAAGVYVVDFPSFSDHCRNYGWMPQIHLARRFVEAGGRVVLINPNSELLHAFGAATSVVVSPCAITDEPYLAKRFWHDGDIHGVWINPERHDNPVFRGLPRERLEWWTDTTGWDETRRGHPDVFPVTTRIDLTGPDALRNTAVLANFGRGLERVAMVEVFIGKGSVIVPGFNLTGKVHVDPVADRLLANIVNYAAGSDEGHQRYRMIDKKMAWGDFLAEAGIVCGPIQGLLPRLDGPLGRSPAGPYHYTKTCHTRLLDIAEKPERDGFFYARVPEGTIALVTSLKHEVGRQAKSAATVRISVRPADCTSPPAYQELELEPGAVGELRNPIPGGCTEIRVDVRGPASIIMLESRTVAPTQE